jgi:hypothetical protein
MADMNKASAPTLRRIANAEIHILYHLDQDLKWDGPQSNVSKLTHEEKLTIIHRVYRALKRRAP